MEKSEKKNEYTQLNVLQNFEYAKTPVTAGIVHTIELVALRPVCENLGLNWTGALQRIKRNANLVQLCVSAKQVADDGKSYEMVCMAPGAFQDWLWGLPTNENLNMALWEEYKKGLVVYLLMMLKLSLAEIKKLQMVAEQFTELKSDVTLLIKADDEGKDYSRLAKEKFKETKEIKERIIQRMSADVDQMRIPFESK